MTTTPFTSPDLATERLAALKAHLPEIFTADGKIDLQALASVDGIEPLREHYRFEWSGKTAARRKAYSPASSTLTFLEDKSVGVEHAKGNAIIEGENLEVLKLLLASYRRQVKCIYIDPPYNTGNDFVYDDDYKEDRTPYWQQTGQVENGVRIDSNTESDGRYHSNWLNMIYPRLIVARELLRDDGVIFVSIDDNEVHNLRKVMDEVFGEENFVAQLCHKARASVSNDKIISSNHNHIILFAKTKTVIEANRWHFGTTPELDDFKHEDEAGHYKLVPVDGPGGASKGNPYYTFEGVTGYFRFSVATMQNKWNAGLLVKKGNSLYQKLYLHDAEKTKRTVTTWWDDGYLTSTASSDLRVLLDGDYFDHPKSVKLLTRIFSLWTHGDNDLILDFFGGSGSTAQAVLELNKADGGNRRFILVQLPELTDAKSEAFKAGYKKISDITMERVKRVINGYGKKPDTLAGHAGCGFAAYRLSRSHFPRQDWAPDPKAGQDANAAAFEAWVSHYEKSLYLQATPSDVLDEVLLKCGFDLARRIEAAIDAPQTVWQVWRSGDDATDATRTPPRALLCLETPVSSVTVDYLVSRADVCKEDGTRLIVLAAALDATAKWNLRHAFDKLLTVF